MTESPEKIANAEFGFRIGGYVFDIETLQLKDPNGKSVYLRPQTAQVLHLLAQKAGEVVSKDDLIIAVWKDFNVTDDSLVQCITEIRKALNDKDRRFVKTFPKRGYILMLSRGVANEPKDAPDPDWLYDIIGATLRPIVFLKMPENHALISGVVQTVQICAQDYRATVLVQDAGLWALSLENIPHALGLALQLRTRLTGISSEWRIGIDLVKSATLRAPSMHAEVVERLRCLTDYAASGEIVAVEGIKEGAIDQLDCIFHDRAIAQAGAAPSRLYSVLQCSPHHRIKALALRDNVLPTIAIIPLASGPSPSAEAIGDIVADDLIMFLSRSQEINVISRLSTAPFRNRSAGLYVIRSAFCADYVLSGSVRTNATSAIVNLELTDLENDRVLWADRLETSLASIVEETAFVNLIANFVRRALMLKSLSDVKKQSLNTIKAHNLLSAAIFLMHRLRRDDFINAGKLLDVLIERAPLHATPLAWLARWHVLRLQQGWTEDMAGSAQAALDCARRALDLNPENTLALTSEGHVLTNLWRRLDEAEVCYDTALEINPNDANGRLLRGMLYGYQGKGDAAKSDTERALRLAPHDPNRFFFLALAAGANIVAGDYERALDLSDQSLRLNRSHTSTIRGKIVAQIGLRQVPAARETARQLLELQPNFRVSSWLQTSPAGPYKIGKHIAESLL